MDHTIVLRPAPGTPDDCTGRAEDFGRPITLHRRMPEVRLPVCEPELDWLNLDPSPSAAVEFRTVTAYATGRYEIHGGERAEVYLVGPPAGERAPAPLPMITPEQERELIEHFPADVQARVIRHLEERPVTYDDDPSVILDAIRAHMAPRPRFAVAAEQAETVQAIADSARLPIQVTGVPWLEPGTGVLLSPEDETPEFGGVPVDPRLTHGHWNVVPDARIRIQQPTYSGVVSGAAISPPGAEPSMDAEPFDVRPHACWSCDFTPGLDALDGLCDECWERLAAEGGEG